MAAQGIESAKSSASKYKQYALVGAGIILGATVISAGIGALVGALNQRNRRGQERYGLALQNYGEFKGSHSWELDPGFDVTNIKGKVVTPGRDWVVSHHQLSGALGLGVGVLLSHAPAFTKSSMSRGVAVWGAATGVVIGASHLMNKSASLKKKIELGVLTSTTALSLTLLKSKGRLPGGSVSVALGTAAVSYISSKLLQSTASPSFDIL